MGSEPLVYGSISRIGGTSGSGVFNLNDWAQIQISTQTS